MEDKNLPGFLEACSTDSFGIGSQSVTDRDVLKLDTDYYTTHLPQP